MPKIVDPQLMKTKILDAAMAVFTEIGIHAATVSSIAKRSGLGKGTLYLYFESKEALTIALVQRVFEDLGKTAMPDRDFQTLDEFLQHVRSCMDLSEESAKSVHVFFEVFGPSFQSREFVDCISSYFDRLGIYYGDSLSSLQARGEVAPEIQPQASGRALASMIDGMSLHRGLFSLPQDRYHAMIDEMISIMAKGLRLEHAPSNPSETKQHSRKA